MPISVGVSTVPSHLFHRPTQHTRQWSWSYFVLVYLYTTHNPLLITKFLSTVFPPCVHNASENLVAEGIVIDADRTSVLSLTYLELKWSGNQTRLLMGEQCDVNTALTAISCDASSFWCTYNLHLLYLK